MRSTERAEGKRRWLPGRILWLAVGIGSILVAASYALTIGSYPAVLGAYAEQATLFAALRGGLLSLHAVGSTLQLLGLLLAFLFELRWRGSDASDRLLQGGGIAALLIIAAAAAGLIDPNYIAAAVYLCGAMLAGAIWMRTPARAPAA